jgi:flagellar biosynthesis/type III secretory pathway protein FliH
MTAFKTLQDAAMNQKRDEAKMSKAVTKARKAAEASQLAAQIAATEMERHHAAEGALEQAEMQAKAEAKKKGAADARWAKVREAHKRQQAMIDSMASVSSAAQRS